MCLLMDYISFNFRVASNNNKNNNNNSYNYITFVTVFVRCTYICGGFLFLKQNSSLHIYRVFFASTIDTEQGMLLFVLLGTNY